MKIKKGLYYLILAILIGVFAFSAYKIGSYYYAKWKNSKLTTLTVERYTKSTEVQTTEYHVVDLAALQRDYKNAVAWIDSPDTVINYPVLQCDNNEYYLHHLMDGSYNVNGSIFMDCNNAPDFSDRNTILYGHHMKNGSMFASLMNYKKSGYYEEHDHMYITLPGGVYRMDLLCGAVVEPDDAIYSINPSIDAVNACMNRSTFKTKMEAPTADTKIVTLSTCSYEYDDARYAVLGVLTPVEK